LAHMSISTYFRPNIHQNGPEILGVNKLHIWMVGYPSWIFLLMKS
jgi:hypothetical protein